MHVLYVLRGSTDCKDSVVTVQISVQISEAHSFFSAIERGIKCGPRISWYDSCCALGSLCTMLGQWDGVGDDYEGERDTHTLLPPTPQCICSLLFFSLSLWIPKTRGTHIHNDTDIVSVMSLITLCEDMLWSLQLSLPPSWQLLKARKSEFGQCGGTWGELGWVEWAVSTVAECDGLSKSGQTHAFCKA